MRGKPVSSEWQQHFAPAPQVLGKTLFFNEVYFKVADGLAESVVEPVMADIRTTTNIGQHRSDVNW